MARIKKGRPLSGVLILDKPQGMTSNRALQKVRHLYQAQKGGHTGSLDPLATGVLPLCLGDATKFSAFLLDADKTYIATARLGEITATSDSEGEVLERRPVPALSVAELEAVLDRFRGPIKQVPTMYSALKFEGRPLYEYARRGIEVARKARDVTIKQLWLDEFSGATLRITVQCTKGTYIRTLVEDIGLALGCGAHVTQLRRTEAGHFTLAQSYALDDLLQRGDSAHGMADLDGLLLPIDSLVPQFPELTLEGENLESIFNGQAVRIPPAEIQGLGLGSWVKVYNSGHTLPGLIDASLFCFAPGRFFVGLGEMVAAPDGAGLMLQPRRLIRMPEAEMAAQEREGDTTESTDTESHIRDE